jgi:hypothetical protein
VTMRNAKRSEEEPGKQTRPVTMRNAKRSEEEPGNRTRPVIYQVFQCVSCSAGNRLAGLKSVPLV